jgi:hypothetical protein
VNDHVDPPKRVERGLKERFDIVLCGDVGFGSDSLTAVGLDGSHCRVDFGWISRVMRDDRETVLGEPKCHSVANPARGTNNDRYPCLLCHDDYSSEGGPAYVLAHMRTQLLGRG